MEQKKEYGIYFLFERKKTKASPPLSEDSNMVLIQFHAGEKNPELLGPNIKFSTLSPQVSKVIEEICEEYPTYLHGYLELEHVLPLGGLALIVDHKNQVIETSAFFPTIELVPVPELKEMFERIGLAAKLENHALSLIQKELNAEYKRENKGKPRFRLKSDSRQVSEERMRQLLKQGRLFGQPPLLEHHLTMLRKYIAERRKFKPDFKPPKMELPAKRKARKPL